MASDTRIRDPQTCPIIGATIEVDRLLVEGSKLKSLTRSSPSSEAKRRVVHRWHGFHRWEGCERLKALLCAASTDLLRGHRHETGDYWRFLAGANAALCPRRPPYLSVSASPREINLRRRGGLHGLQHSAGRAHDVVAAVDVQNFAGDAVGHFGEQKRPAAADFLVRDVSPQRRHFFI